MGFASGTPAIATGCRFALVGGVFGTPTRIYYVTPSHDDLQRGLLVAPATLVAGAEAANRRGRRFPVDSFGLNREARTSIYKTSPEGLVCQIAEIISVLSTSRLLRVRSNGSKGGANAKQLAFAPLLAFAGFDEAGFAALFGARVALKESFFFKNGAEVRVICGERA